MPVLRVLGQCSDTQGGTTHRNPSEGHQAAPQLMLQVRSLPKQGSVVSATAAPRPLRKALTLLQELFKINKSCLFLEVSFVVLVF